MYVPGYIKIMILGVTGSTHTPMDTLCSVKKQPNRMHVCIVCGVLMRAILYVMG